jgi:transposase, IS5 family
MLSKQKLSHQIDIFNAIGDQLNQNHPLYKLANTINWKLFDDSFSTHYCLVNGRPAMPIRLMVSLLILKHLRNLSDENVVEQWAENMYYQYFSGEIKFKCKEPCVPTDLVSFRDRIGEPGLELIFKESVKINDDITPMDKDNLVISVDTTIQEKNITYPSDDKHYKKIIKWCWKIADMYAIDLRRSYSQKLKSLSTIQRFKNNKNGRKNARKANKAIQTIAGALLREVNRKLPLEHLGKYLDTIKLYTKVVNQKRGDSNKIYSLHEPDVKCYSKGKAHKKYEFGSKVSIGIDQKTGIIVAAFNVTQTIHDSKTIPDVIEQCKRVTTITPKEAYVDRGYRGAQTYDECKIQIPKPEKNITKEKRKKHSNRAAIEPIIGHLKKDYRLCRNFYKGIKGDNINVLLSAAAMNFKRVMNLWSTEAILRWLLKIKNQIMFLGKTMHFSEKRVYEGRLVRV